jgi:hypothetical protein
MQAWAFHPHDWRAWFERGTLLDHSECHEPSGDFSSQIIPDCLGQGLASGMHFDPVPLLFIANNNGTGPTSTHGPGEERDYLLLLIYEQLGQGLVTGAVSRPPALTPG